MRLWIDCEWNDYKGALISMALVPEDVDTAPWYAVLECKNPSPWVAEHVMKWLDGSVAYTASPIVSREYMQESLQRFLCLFDTVHIIADWPEDIERFCELLILGPGQRIGTPPLTMEVRRDINSDASEVPHNALADARAMRKMHLALAPAPADGWVSVKPLTYLAAPYSHPERSVRVARFEAINKVAAELMRKGLLIYSPISHTHPIAEAGSLPLGWEFWQKYDTAFIEHSNKVIVLMLDGWKESKGVIAECKLAHKLGVPVEYREAAPAEGARE